MRNGREGTPSFGIVIPLGEPSGHLHQCLSSIYSAAQSGFRVSVIVQQSEKFRSVKRQVESISRAWDDGFVELRYCQSDDQGPATAIAEGFSRIDADLLSWLGDDDMLLPTTFATIAGAKQSFPEFQWFTGLPYLASSEGIAIPHSPAVGFTRFPTGFSRHFIAQGLHASVENHGFIQQEGSFFSRAVYLQAGGMPIDYSLAFDFVLWSNLAAETELIEIAAPLGIFRKRAGQLSSNRAGYFSEISRFREGIQVKSNFSVKPAAYVSFDGTTFRWVMHEIKYLGLSPRVSALFFTPIESTWREMHKIWLQFNRKATSNFLARVFVVWARKILKACRRN